MKSFSHPITTFGLIAVFAFFAGRSSLCSANPPVNHPESITLTFQLGGQTARLMISAIGNCILLSQLPEGDRPPSVENPLPSELSVEVPQADPSRDDLPKGNRSEESVTDRPVQPGPEIKGEISEEDIATQKNASEQESKPSPEVGHSDDPSISNSTPLLPSDRPDWVGRPALLQGKDYFVSIETFPDTSLEKSLVSLDESLLQQTRRFIDERLLMEAGAAAKLDHLDVEWIKSNLLVSGKQYNAQFESADAIYHQAWVELKIGEREQRIIEHWWKDIVRHERAKKLGGGLASLVAGIGMLHLLVGFVARRKRK